MSVTTSLELKNIVKFHFSYNIIIVSLPYVSRLMRPSNVMSTVCTSALMGENCNSFVSTSLETLTMRAIEILIVLFDLFFFGVLLELLEESLSVFRDHFPLVFEFFLVLFEFGIAFESIFFLLLFLILLAFL